jgi:hypothetical protein
MATKATSTIRCTPIPAAVAIVVLGGMLIGCQAGSAALMYAQEAHAQKVAAWCHAYSGTTASLQEDCVRRVWINVPASDYWIKHNSTVNGTR